MTNGIDLLHII